jgi:hypothetical protein
MSEAIDWRRLATERQETIRDLSERKVEACRERDEARAVARELLEEAASMDQSLVGEFATKLSEWTTEEDYKRPWIKKHPWLAEEER